MEIQIPIQIEIQRQIQIQIEIQIQRQIQIQIEIQIQRQIQIEAPESDLAPLAPLYHASFFPV